MVPKRAFLVAVSILCLLIGTSMVFAQNDTTQDTGQPGETEPLPEENGMEDLEDGSDPLRERIREAVGDAGEAIRGTIDEQDTEAIAEQLRERIRAAVDEARAQLRARIESERRAAYREARSSYVEAAEAYAQARRELAQEDPNEIGTQIRKRVASTTVERLERYLDLLEERIVEGDRYTVDERDELLETIGDYRTRLGGAQERIAAAQTPAELARVIGEMRSEWARMQSTIRTIAGEDMLRSLNDLAAQTRSLGNRIDERIDLLEDRGYDVAELETLKSEYDAHLSRAREHVENARRTYAGDPTPREHENARGEIVQARQELHEARLVLRTILEHLRDAEGSV
jgi:hypothetical protein